MEAHLSRPRSAPFTDGVSETLNVVTAPSALGCVLVAFRGAGIAAILIGDDDAAVRGALAHRCAAARLVPTTRAHMTLVDAVLAMIAEPGRPHALPLDVRGSAFQLRVWAALQDIKPGTRATYGEIARAIGAPRAVRAVAGACAANVHAVAIPCHRVVRADGTLSGYRFGVERKALLLAREANAAERPAPQL